jgi:C4-dicarboxylate-specific signal transduction histidine kinase
MDYDPTSAQTAALLEQLLRIARMSALEEMASGIAHELNQPIGAIATFAQTAERMLDRPQPLIDDARNILRHISGEAFKAAGGIRRVRALFSGQDVATETCALADVLEELRPILYLLATRSNAYLQIDVQESLPLVRIDRLRIQHVIFTLVQNAMEAPNAIEAAPRVRVELRGDRYAVSTTVTDEGPGVGDDAREHLFRPFFTTKPGGTGLGLASSRAIVEAHGGTIGFENLPTGGAQFWFRMPAATGDK